MVADLTSCPVTTSSREDVVGRVGGKEDQLRWPNQDKQGRNRMVRLDVDLRPCARSPAVVGCRRRLALSFDCS